MCWVKFVFSKSLVLVTFVLHMVSTMDPKYVHLSLHPAKLVCKKVRFILLVYKFRAQLPGYHVQVAELISLVVWLWQLKHVTFFLYLKVTFTKILVHLLRKLSYRVPLVLLTSINSHAKVYQGLAVYGIQPYKYVNQDQCPFLKTVLI